ncbi:MAG: 3-phosphoshikimate 1-carboxyvinyltransferase [Oscillospiraceae bacterium]|nr:3-phosphoshikimate 1-carboxyvinyltransferase [Oscillospiraceae bacterium]
MNITPGQRRGTVTAPASKSHAQRLLLAAALGRAPVTLRCRGLSRDIAAMIDCLRSLGAEIAIDGDALRVTPIAQAPRGTVDLPCAESGATLRFLLPVAGALGVSAVFRPTGRKRPIAPLTEVLRAHGMEITAEDGTITCKGKLLAGDYTIGAETSSQYITGLLYALPLLRGESTLTLTGEVVSAPYLALTEQVLRGAGIRFERSGDRYTVPGGQGFAQGDAVVEGDWSGAAAFLCMGALSRDGVRVCGLNMGSLQSDRAIVERLLRFGAGVELTGDGVTVRRGSLLGGRIDVSQTPDLLPVLAAVAATAAGETCFTGAMRLRDKESDRLQTTAAMLTALGADAEETADALTVRGKGRLRGGTVDAANDHRVAMAAAVAACVCQQEIIINGAACIEKSYPAFWEDFACLSM